MYKALHLSPMIPSYDLVETTSFFRDVLGFEDYRVEKQYVILQKDGLTIHFLRAGADIGEIEFYLEVSNVDEVWDKMKDKVAPDKVKAPFDQPYGMREIHVFIPATKTLLFVGQAIR